MRRMGKMGKKDMKMLYGRQSVDNHAAESEKIGERQRIQRLTRENSLYHRFANNKVR